MENIKEPHISVGIMQGTAIHFRLTGEFINDAGLPVCQGEHCLSIDKDCIFLDGTAVSVPLTLKPVSVQDAEFELADVTIGINFHWQKEENQRFRGALKFILEDRYLTAVNVLALETYLLSVISSEMNADSPLELLKAHAVISRSWLLAQKSQVGKRLQGHGRDSIPGERIEWWDREDHKNFDVCADDHCQRYQGISKISNPGVRKALEATCGEVLTCQDRICDARFSKCCGGMTERFESAWENTVHPYLKRVTDAPVEKPLDLSMEENARQWILAAPADSFCNTSDRKLLKTILNNFDVETQDFYRWKVSYSIPEISALIRKKLGYDFGEIQELVPVERGCSGRIVRLRIVGTKRTETIGKELLVRKALSETHLYSSAFVVDKQKDRFILTGAGWGHGVGLCQIGAAVMASRGYGYREILTHYFPDTALEKIY